MRNILYGQLILLIIIGLIGYYNKILKYIPNIIGIIFKF